MKLWGGRFQKPTDKLVEEFNASINFDKTLAEVDILGSLAHVSMLGHCKLLTEDEVKTITDGLHKIAEKVQQQTIEFTIADEDIHMNIERLLHQDIGAVAGKIHTGRSRNDQVALDMHLFMRENVLQLIEKLKVLQATLLAQAEQHIDTILPGYTHLQRAQPIRLSQHLLAYIGMLQRDIERLQDSFPRINTSPLGAGALAGAGFGIDREYVANYLGFERLYENSMDAVSDRDFVVEFLSHASITSMHLSRLSEELILWCSKEFSFVELDDAYTTGSSMMPQKKNPDVAELVRGKTGRIYGALIGMLTLLKGLPLTYNKDMQEDKEGVFDTLKTLHDCLDLYAPMIETMQVNKDAMRAAATNDFSNATEIADYLVTKDMPFREAHAVSGRLVMHCIENKKLLMDLSLETYQEFSNLFDADVFDAIALESVVDARNARGGTARNSVLQQITIVKQTMQQTTDWLSKKMEQLTR